MSNGSPVYTSGKLPFLNDSGQIDENSGWGKVARAEFLMYDPSWCEPWEGLAQHHSDWEKHHSTQAMKESNNMIVRPVFQVQING
jgi:hypothetical protein